MYSLTFNSLYVILNTPKLIIKSETWLLKRLIKWYINHKQKLEKEQQQNLLQTVYFEKEEIEVKEEGKNEEKIYEYSIESFIDLIYKVVSLDQVDWKYMKDKYNKILKELMLDDYSGNKNHFLINFKDIDERLLKIIYKYYIDENKNIIESMFISTILF